jgi:Holliday junction resolvase-like predicted endonuclease
LSVERKLLLSLLKLTKNSGIKQEIVAQEAKLPLSVTSVLLNKLQNENLVYLRAGIIEVNSEFRLKIAMKAIELGADIECINSALIWQEFEAMAASSLELNGYIAKKNVRFKHEGKRREIDVVGCRKPIVLCIDCKHWLKGMNPSTVAKMAGSQAERVEAFANSLPKIDTEYECTKWGRAKFVPIIISLIPSKFKFCNNIPIVPILQLQDFISQLPFCMDSIRFFERKSCYL